MKLNVDVLKREFIEIEITVDGETYPFRFYKLTGKQKKEIRNLYKKDNLKIYEVDELSESQFLERLQGDEAAKEKLLEFFDENGGLEEFSKECEKNLGKLKNKV